MAVKLAVKPWADEGFAYSVSMAGQTNPNHLFHQVRRWCQEHLGAGGDYYHRDPEHDRWCYLHHDSDYRFIGHIYLRSDREAVEFLLRWC